MKKTLRLSRKRFRVRSSAFSVYRDKQLCFKFISPEPQKMLYFSSRICYNI